VSKNIRFKILNRAGFGGWVEVINSLGTDKHSLNIVTVQYSNGLF
jgi:hypothetical protein